MSFVRLENLNDFIQPSSTCIKPVEKKVTGVVTKVSDISLSDCLACSGCITSAETVLVQQQNYEELFRIINQAKTSQVAREVVVTLSLQGIAALAHKYNMDTQETAERLSSFFISIGCKKVYDLNLARHLSLVESYKEFKQRKQTNQFLPIISSVCPGWVCYAEKTNGELVIPFLSKVRSPQQIMGSMLKKRFCDITNRTRNDVYHVTLMPCFDKKLEASREDFIDKSDDSRDVDCVLTPLELEEILNDEGVTLADFERRKLDLLVESNDEFDNPLTNHLGSVSGGYAENILLAMEASDTIEKCDKLEYSTTRNNDFIEVGIKRSRIVDGNSNTPLPRVAIVNGFRNIQTVVQRLKRKALKYDYIEIMACPSGCINGGAQCRPGSGEDQAEMVSKTKTLYEKVKPVTLSINHDDEKNRKLYETLKLVDEKTIDELMHTNFHPVPKMQNLAVNW